MSSNFLLSIVFIMAWNGLYGLINLETQVLPFCAVTGGLTGILSHQIKEENRNNDGCDGNECGGRGECVTTFCKCETGYCGKNCQKSDQETGTACPCPIRSSICVEDTCVCECGYTFNETSNICRKDCVKGFADTFTLFDGFSLRATPFAEIPGQIDSILEDVRANCNAACLQEPACVSYSIDTFFLDCSLYAVSKEDVGLFELFFGGTETYERDCIDEMS